ncbi:hypothetical protein [Paenibacillus sp. y28]|uniref:hypothetical protein n=1 Tax=Paenibacillus sp. y28 TaxID=3129110 RepID=UPI003019C357
MAAQQCVQVLLGLATIATIVYLSIEPTYRSVQEPNPMKVNAEQGKRTLPDYYVRGK